MAWQSEQLAQLRKAETLTMQPYNPDMTTFEEVSPIWEVVVDGAVYVRGWNGKQTKWYQAATAQTAGQVKVGEKLLEAKFSPVADATVIDQVTAAYRQKYAGDASLARMVSTAPAQATLKVEPNLRH